jgi:DNA-directed RNA polymerase beta subunit
MAAAADVDEPPASLAALVAPHIDSFDFFLTEGLQRVSDALQPCEVVHPTTGARLSVWLEALRVGKPVREESRATESIREMRVFPRECRQAGTSYTAPLLARVCWQVDDGDAQFKEVRLSDVPVMVRNPASVLPMLGFALCAALLLKLCCDTGSFLVLQPPCAQQAGAEGARRRGDGVRRLFHRERH